MEIAVNLIRFVPTIIVTIASPILMYALAIVAGKLIWPACSFSCLKKNTKLSLKMYITKLHHNGHTNKSWSVCDGTLGDLRRILCGKFEFCRFLIQQQYDVIVSIKLSPEVGNKEYIVLCVLVAIAWGYVAASRKRSHQWCLILTPDNTKTIERMTSLFLATN